MRPRPEVWVVVVGAEELGGQRDEGQMAVGVCGYARAEDGVEHRDTLDGHDSGRTLVDPGTADPPA